MVTHCLPIMSSYQHLPQDEIFGKPRTQKQQESKGWFSSAFSFCLSLSTHILVPTKIFTKFIWKWVNQERIGAISSKRSVMDAIVILWNFTKGFCALRINVCLLTAPRCLQDVHARSARERWESMASFSKTHGMELGGANPRPCENSGTCDPRK